MTDPAIEAVKRAVGRDHTLPTDQIAAAREALEPLRAEHYSVTYINRQRCCVRCFDEHGKPKVWPCDIARHLYPKDELP